ncbi:adenosylcobalamin-dependent ribonucleoside-diphosphate reductase [Candidatus Woesearchaeota archaeon]|nr:adenosylcobalamin-dependent ribonucleoside-diphosphate reductase [Candidatus Woesearchaeota archaeon]
MVSTGELKHELDDLLNREYEPFARRVYRDMNVPGFEERHFRPSQNSLTTLETRYLDKAGTDKVVESPEGLVLRVAANVALGSIVDVADEEKNAAELNQMFYDDPRIRQALNSITFGDFFYRNGEEEYVTFNLGEILYSDEVRPLFDENNLLMWEAFNMNEPHVQEKLKEIKINYKDYTFSAHKLFFKRYEVPEFDRDEKHLFFMNGGNDAYIFARRDFMLTEHMNGKDVEMPFARTGEFRDYEGRLIENIPTLAEECVRFYELMASCDFMPCSPTLMNAGKRNQMLSACFVFPIKDCMESINKAHNSTTIIQKAGGGTGYNFSKLRPTNDPVYSSGGKTAGPLKFIDMLSAATDAIQQGSYRRGANMGMMEFTHPDCFDFIRAKRDSKKRGGKRWNNYNVSVVMREEDIANILENPDQPYMVVNPRTGKAFAKEKPRGKDDKEVKFWTYGEVFDFIVNMAWESADPGLIFMDRMNTQNPTPKLGEIFSTNPCGEQPLLHYEACNLGSLNLARFVTENDGKKAFDFERFGQVTDLTVRFMDNVNTVNSFPLPEIIASVQGNRKIGLGVMGLAELLFKLEIPYDSEEAYKLGEQIQKTLNDKAYEASQELGKTRGSFPNFSSSVYPEQGIEHMRNATRTTIAPTGTISVIADTTSGIEPLFSPVFIRHVLDGKKLFEANPFFRKIAEEGGFYSKELVDKIGETGSLQHLDEVPDEIKRYFRCAHDVNPEAHLRMQEVFQRHTDNSVSKTVNIRENATVEDVRNIYLAAMKNRNINGITIYRDKTHSNQPMSLMAGGKNGKGGIVWHNYKVPECLEKKALPESFKVRLDDERKVHFTVISRPYRHQESGKVFFYPYEIFIAALPKPGHSEAETQMKGVDITDILKNRDLDLIKFITTRKSLLDKEYGMGAKKVYGLSHAIGAAFEHILLRYGVIEHRENLDGNPAGLEQKVWFRDLEQITEENEVRQAVRAIVAASGNGTIEHDFTSGVGLDVCPECGSKLVHESGCHGGSCPNPSCGYSKCS